MDIPVRETFPRQTSTVPTEWITLSDGTRLAATLWLPVDALERPVSPDGDQPTAWSRPSADEQ